MTRIDQLIDELPDSDEPRRFLKALEDRLPSSFASLSRNEPLLSDVVTITAFSPFLATTILQHPEYLPWLDRQRKDTSVKSKEAIMESLARFALTNSSLDLATVYARFRRRELLRIYLRDIRRLATVAEITEEISNLADAILESGLAEADRQAAIRFGMPLRQDEKGRDTGVSFCVLALGKLGSRELNYSSDIDLVFMYSDEGVTTGGTKGTVTVREYYSKVAEIVSKLVGERSGEGGAYRVDLRLRPHGRIGALALSVPDMVRYYRTEARPWELQVLLRSRASAGDPNLYSRFNSDVEEIVFGAFDSTDEALASVRRSKSEIDRNAPEGAGYNVKLGKGGIREIEFIAQALQLAYGTDRWMRSPHTLISLSRLADRGHISTSELTSLVAAYEFLRRTEHVLQMESGIQTHTIPSDPVRLKLLGQRVMFGSIGDFETALEDYRRAVSRIYERIFSQAAAQVDDVKSETTGREDRSTEEHSETTDDPTVARFEAASPHFAAVARTRPDILEALAEPFDPDDAGYKERMLSVIDTDTFRDKLAALRRRWTAEITKIAAADAFGSISTRDAKRSQTLLAEASIDAAIKVVESELVPRPTDNGMPLSVLGLGKLGSRGLDYGSDLDLILVYDDESAAAPELYARAAELFVTVLSSMTRDGSMYRVDLRLRPYGSNGVSALPGRTMAEYFKRDAAIWEMLAYLKLRPAGGDLSLGDSVAKEVRSIIFDRASKLSHKELKSETHRIRTGLESRGRTRHSRDIDIKYGPGGMLDVYFATRCLQLCDSVEDDPDDRSTLATIRRLAEFGSLDETAADIFADGYSLLAAVDHELRLIVGRRTSIPRGNATALGRVAERTRCENADELIDRINLARMNIRDAYLRVIDANGLSR